ncbi:MAG: siderophore-interacting protein [Arachnia sp.]
MNFSLRRCESSATLAMAAHVIDVQDLCPTLRRITLGGEDLTHLGVEGPTLDCRVKIVVPDAGATPASVLACLANYRPEAPRGDDAQWYRNWLVMPTEQRGAMRTYTVRELRETPSGTELVIDFVLHLCDDETGSVDGPATLWASRATPGDSVAVVGPNRRLCGPDYAGIEWRPGTARDVLLAGDETALPAVAGILAHLSSSPDADQWSGDVLLEVPCSEDRIDVVAPPAVTITWLVRDGAPRGTLLAGAVAEAAPPATKVPWHAIDDVDVDATILWETGTVGSSDRYAWVAGEAGMLKQLRRWLLGPAGMTKAQVAIMGYWREGRSG